MLFIHENICFMLYRQGGCCTQHTPFVQPFILHVLPHTSLSATDSKAKIILNVRQQSVVVQP